MPKPEKNQTFQQQQQQQQKTKDKTLDGVKFTIKVTEDNGKKPKPIQKTSSEPE